MEPGEGASFRIEMQAGDKGIHREDDVLLPPGKFKVTSIDDNGDIVLTPVSQQTGPQVLKVIEDVLDDMPAPLNHEEEHRRKMVYNAVRRGQARATTKEPSDDEEIRIIYPDPANLPRASVNREFNELADRHKQRPLTDGEKGRMETLARFLRIRSTGDPDLPDPDDSQPNMPRIIETPGLPSQRGFRSSRADVDLDENGVHTDDSGIRMVYDRATGEWRHLKIRRNPVKDRRGRSLLQQYTGRTDENGEGIFEDLPLVPNGDGIMFQWDGERWRPDLSQVSEDDFNLEVGLVVEDGDGGFSRYDPVTETWSDYSVHARDIQHVPSKHNLRTNWRLRHTGFLMRDSRLGDPRPGASSDHREMAVPLPTDIMYHGSPEEFDEFMFGARLSGNAGGAKNPDSGLGFHFSPFEQTASGMGNHVKVVHIRMNNPVHIDDLQTVKLLRQRALISELGLDDVYEEAFTEYLRRKPELFDMLRGDESIMERMVDLPRTRHETYDPHGFLRTFMDELERVTKWHEHLKEHGRAPAPWESWRDFNDNGWGIPELTGLLTPEQLEDNALMRFRGGADVVGEEGIGTRNDEITREWIKSFGYDGLIIKEAYMGRPKGEDTNQVGKMNSGDPRQSSYVVLDPDQITTADPPERTPAQLAAREKMRAHMASLEEHGIRVDNSNFAAKANDHFIPFDVRVTVGDEVLFEGGEPKPTNKTGHAIFEDLFWANHGEAAWQRDQEKRSVDEIADEYLRVGGLASRRNSELKRSLDQQQERLTENMRARRRTQDPAELAELAEDFEYLAGIERSDRREFNRNNQIGLQSSRGSTDRNVRARMRDKDEERRVARRRVGGTTGDIFIPDDVFVEEATDPQRPLGGGVHDWTVDTRENKVGRALDSASGAIEHFRGGGGDGDVPLPKAVRRFIADNTDEEILDRLRQAAREYVSDFDPRIRIAAKRQKVDEILADPDRRFKSTHEAASEMSPADARRELELTWGIPLDAPADLRPISGSLDHKEYRKLKAAWINARRSDRPQFRNTDPDFLPDYWGEIAPSGPATWVYGGGQTGGSIEFVLKADRANDSAVVFGDSALQGAKRPTGMTSTDADDLLAAILYPETTVSANHVGRNRTENRQHVMSLLNGSLTGDWSGVLDPGTHQRAAQQGVSSTQAASVSNRYAEALVPGGFDFEDVEHVSMPVGTFNVPDELAPGDLGRNNQELLDALASFNLSDTELDQLLSDYGSSGHHYATYMRNYLGMLEKKRELRKLGLETVFPNHDAIDYFDPATWLSLPPTAWGGTQPSPNSNVYELLQHLIRADIIRRRQTLVDTIRRPAPVYDPAVSVV